MDSTDWREKYLKEAEAVNPSIVTRPVPAPPLDSLPDDTLRADAWLGSPTILQGLLDAATFRLRADIAGQGYWTPWQLCRGVWLMSVAAGLYGTGQSGIDAARASLQVMFSGPPKLLGGHVERWILRRALIKIGLSLSRRIITCTYRLR